MGSESDFLEIIILGAIAAFLIYRLASTLGQNTGFQQPLSKENLAKRVKSATNPSIKPGDSQSATSDPIESIPDHLQKNFAALKQQEPDFSLKTFLEGATNAYEIIVKAFAAEDLETLQSLMNKKIYRDFQETIQDRQGNQMTLDTTIIRVCNVTAETIKIEGAKAVITVTFTTEQTHVLKDAEGTIIEGSSRQIEEVTDTWTFSKSLRTQSPNWTLIATGE